MDNQTFSKIVQRAKDDPKFLHQLVFEPSAILSDLKDLSRPALGRMIGQDPLQLIATAVGVREGCGNTCTSSCDNTCGKSCGFTTNLQASVGMEVMYFSQQAGKLMACGNTCTSSCDNTCGGSCGFTTNLTDIAQNFGTSAR